MQKFYLLGCLATLAVAGAFAQTTPQPDNEAFYLVGTMNGWQLPLQDPDNTRYRVTDEDGDGIYSASFEIPAGECQFKVFSEPVDNWEDPEVFYGGYYDSPMFLFENEGNTIYMTKGFDSYNVVVPNWAGGNLSIELQWEWMEYSSTWTPKMTLTGSNQPQRPAVPEIYVVGDFNDWQLPDQQSVNDAIKLTHVSSNNSGYYVWEDLEFAAQNSIATAICQFDRATGKYYFLNFDYGYCPFTLYAYEGNDDEILYPYFNLYGNWQEGTDPKKAASTINDWKGGTIQFFVNTPFPNSTIRPYLSLYSGDTPVTEKPEQLYYIIERDGQKDIYPCTFFTADYGYNFYIWAQSAHGPASITITSENSLDPDPANCWGVTRPLSEEGLSATNPQKRVPFVKGGEPFYYDFENAGKITVDFLFRNSVASIELEFIGGPIAADKIYICGDVMNGDVMNGFTTPSAANEAFYDEYFRLTEVSKGVFEGTYLVPEKENADYDRFPDALPQFRFFSQLVGWRDDYSIGSYPADFYCMPVDLENGPVECTLIDKVLGNWGPCLGTIWTESYVKFTVDINKGTLLLERITTDVEEMELPTVTEEKWYNLQGMPVENPSTGMYIHVVNGKSRVELRK